MELTSVNSSVNPTLKMGAAQINDFFMASLWHSEVKGLAQIQVESTQSCWMSGSIRQKWGAVSVVPASPVTMSATQLGLTNTWLVAEWPPSTTDTRILQLTMVGIAEPWNNSLWTWLALKDGWDGDWRVASGGLNWDGTEVWPKGQTVTAVWGRGTCSASPVALMWQNIPESRSYDSGGPGQGTAGQGIQCLHCHALEIFPAPFVRSSRVMRYLTFILCHLKMLLYNQVSTSTSNKMNSFFFFNFKLVS